MSIRSLTHWAVEIPYKKLRVKINWCLVKAKKGSKNKDKVIQNSHIDPTAYSPNKLNESNQRKNYTPKNHNDGEQPGQSCAKY